MKKLSDYQRLETHGIWRESRGDPGRSVVVKLSVRHLTIVSKDSRPLAHWSLDAVRHLNPGRRPAVFTPDDNADESVEISDSHVIGLLRNQLSPDTVEPDRQTPVSWGPKITILTLLAAFCGGVYLFSGQIAGGMSGLIPAAQRLEIGERVFSHLTDLTGERCRSTAAGRALKKLESRFFDSGSTVRVVRHDMQLTAHLPGGILVVSDGLFSRHDRFAVFGGYLLEENLRSAQSDPMAVLLRAAGLRAAAAFALRGRSDGLPLREYAEAQISQTKTPVDPEKLLDSFRAAGIPSTPYAQATGSGGPLVALDPYKRTAVSPPLSDREWLDLRSVCLGSAFR